MSSANEQLAPPPKPRMSPLDFRNTDLVSRLLAATPPYLYNMSLLPNTYFFSEMLRSFVQAKSSDRTPASPFQQRRTRKRPWTPVVKSGNSPKPEQMNEQWSSKPPSDAPLELTTPKPPASESESKPDFPPSVSQESPPSGLILPPPPPLWYPSLYPSAAPYGIDPLHFFIDLRVSGHIYDRKNQQREPEPKSDESEPRREGFKPSRHASAFSVPVPRCRPGAEEEPSAQEAKNIRFDVKSMGFERQCNKTGIGYVMANVGSIYRNVAESVRQRVKSENENENETEEQREKRVKDLRALIGLELVVDYMNHARPNPRRIPDQSHCADTESTAAGSPTLEVVAVQDET